MRRLLTLIAGPCALEGDMLNLPIARRLMEIQAAYPVEVYFKGSFDKANRSRHDSKRGPGIEEGARQLDVIRRFGLRTTTDIHEAWQADVIASVCDLIQVPASLCRQTDLVAAAAKTGRRVNIKKARWLGAGDMAFAVGKVRELGGEAMVTERGTFFGYGNLVVDTLNIPRIQEHGIPVILDCTHSLQRASVGGVATAESQYIRHMARVGVAAGADGLFFETHPEPAEAICDGACMIPLNQLEGVVRDAVNIWRAL